MGPEKDGNGENAPSSAAGQDELIVAQFVEPASPLAADTEQAGDADDDDAGAPMHPSMLDPKTPQKITAQDRFVATIRCTTLCKYGVKLPYSVINALSIVV